MVNLNKHTHPSLLVLLRLFTGVQIFWLTASWILADPMYLFFPSNEFMPTWNGGSGIFRLPGVLMLLPFFISLIGAVGIIFGTFYRVSLAASGLSLLYLLALTPAFYSHAAYLSVLWIAVLFCVDADKWTDRSVPFWQVGIVRMQAGLVFVFSALARLNGEWLTGDAVGPLFKGLSQHSLGVLFTNPVSGFLISSVGPFFELALPFLLLIKQVRNVVFPLALLYIGTVYGVVLGQHALMFWMIIGLTAFLSPDFPAKIAAIIRRFFEGLNTDTPSSLPSAKAWAATVLGCVVLVQAGLFYRTTQSYSGKDFRNAQFFTYAPQTDYFRWKLVFLIQDLESGKTFEVNPGQFQVSERYRFIGENPVTVWQFAQFLKEDMKRKLGLSQFKITADYLISKNGESFQRVFDPNVDLATISLSEMGKYLIN